MQILISKIEKIRYSFCHKGSFSNEPALCTDSSHHLSLLLTLSIIFYTYSLKLGIVILLISKYCTNLRKWFKINNSNIVNLRITSFISKLWETFLLSTPDWPHTPICPPGSPVIIGAISSAFLKVFASIIQLVFLKRSRKNLNKNKDCSQRQKHSGKKIIFYIPVSTSQKLLHYIVTNHPVSELLL